MYWLHWLMPVVHFSTKHILRQYIHSIKVKINIFSNDKSSIQKNLVADFCLYIFMFTLTLLLIFKIWFCWQIWPLASIGAEKTVNYKPNCSVKCMLLFILWFMVLNHLACMIKERSETEHHSCSLCLTWYQTSLKIFEYFIQL